MKRIPSSHSTSAGAAPGSTCATKLSPSSTPLSWCSTWPWGESTSAFVRLPHREALEDLAGQGVQPGQPVGSGDPQHPAVGEVDEPLPGVQVALFGVERAIVRGHARVHPGADDGTGQVEQFTGGMHAYLLLRQRLDQGVGFPTWDFSVSWQSRQVPKTVR